MWKRIYLFLLAFYKNNTVVKRIFFEKTSSNSL